MEYDDRGCRVIPYEDEDRAVVLAMQPGKWDDRTFDMGGGVRVHVHEWETPDPEDYEPDEDGNIPEGYVYAEMDMMGEDGEWIEDVDGGVVGYGLTTTLGEWMKDVFGFD